MEVVQQHNQLFMLVQAAARVVVGRTALIPGRQVLLGKDLLEVMVEAAVTIPAVVEAVQPLLVYLQQQTQVTAEMVAQVQTGNPSEHSTEVAVEVVGMAALLEQEALVAAGMAAQPQLVQMERQTPVVGVAVLGLIA